MRMIIEDDDGNIQQDRFVYPGERPAGVGMTHLMIDSFDMDILCRMPARELQEMFQDIYSPQYIDPR